MTLENYLLQSLMDEKEIVEELLRVDNNVQKTNYTYEEVLRNLKKLVSPRISLEIPCNFVTDGEPDTVYNILVRLTPYVQNLHINRKFVAINKWLVERTKEYYKEQGIQIPLSLDVERGYDKYIEDDRAVIIYGFSEFTEGIKDIFYNKNMAIIEK